MTATKPEHQEHHCRNQKPEDLVERPTNHSVCDIPEQGAVEHMQKGFHGGNLDGQFLLVAGVWRITMLEGLPVWENCLDRFAVFFG